MGYSKAPEQQQSSARSICHSHTMSSTGCEPATIRIAAQELAALRTAPWEVTYSRDCCLTIHSRYSQRAPAQFC